MSTSCMPFRLNGSKSSRRKNDGKQQVVEAEDLTVISRYLADLVLGLGTALGRNCIGPQASAPDGRAPYYILLVPYWRRRSGKWIRHTKAAAHRRIYGQKDVELSRLYWVRHSGVLRHIGTAADISQSKFLEKAITFYGDTMQSAAEDGG